MSDLPGADHDTSRWSVCAAAVVPGQPVVGPDGQAAERNHPEVLHASDAGMILVNPGTGCSTAVEPTPHERELVGSNPAWCWAFSLLYSIRSVSLIRSLVVVVPAIKIQVMPSCAA